MIYSIIENTCISFKLTIVSLLFKAYIFRCNRDSYYALRNKNSESMANEPSISTRRNRWRLSFCLPKSRYGINYKIQLFYFYLILFYGRGHSDVVFFRTLDRNSTNWKDFTGRKLRKRWLRLGVMEKKPSLSHQYSVDNSDFPNCR